MTAFSKRTSKQTKQTLQPLFLNASAVLGLVAVPCAMGGRHPIGYLFLTAAALVAVLGWIARVASMPRQQYRIGIAEVLFACGLLIGCVQLVPLSPTLLSLISPQLSAWFPFLNEMPTSAAGLGGWNRVSVVPGETLRGLGIFLSQGILVTIFAQRAGHTNEIHRLLNVIVFATGILATIGIAQYLAGNGKYLWFYDFLYNDASGVVKGTFTNRNHFASFLALGWGAVGWFTFCTSSNGRPVHQTGRVAKHFSTTQNVYAAGSLRTVSGFLLLAMVTFAGALSLSRGGILAIATAALVSLISFKCIGVIGWRSTLAIGCTAALVVSALFIHGLDQVSGRLDDFFDETHFANGFGRLDVWKAACSAVTDFPILGTGIGSHAEVSPIYMPATNGIVFTHAENSYLNLAVETGLVGLFLGGIGIVAAIVATIILLRKGTHEEKLIATAFGAALAAGGVHAATDFIWYVPACSTLLFLAGATMISLASRRCALLPACTFELDRISASIAGMFLLVVLGATGFQQFRSAFAQPHWETAVRDNASLGAIAFAPPEKSSTADDNSDSDDSTASITNLLPAESIDPEVGKAIDTLSRMISSLEQVLLFRPDHPHAWSTLAIARLERFGLRRRASGFRATLCDLEQAALASEFSSRESFELWLRETLGDDVDELVRARHDALESVDNNPLSGEAWCVLARLSFLFSPDPERARHLIDQACVVRPHNGQVLFEAGNAALINGDTERAWSLWRQSFAASRSQRQMVLRALLHAVPASEVCRLLSPDLDGLRAIDVMWSFRSTPEEMRDVRQQRLLAVQKQLELFESMDRVKAPPLRLEAASLQKRLGDIDAAAATLETALNMDPGLFDPHRMLIDVAMDRHDWTTARREVEWCLMRRPESSSLKILLTKAVLAASHNENSLENTSPQR